MLLSRLADTGVGVAVGLLVNLIVWPPLRDRSAAHRIDAIDDRIGELLTDMARDLRRDRADDWIVRTNDLDHDVDEAWQGLGQARESARLNPRRAVARRMREAERFASILGRLEQAVAETRSMASTIALSRVAPAEWDERFREPWVDLLERAGAAIGRADVAALTAVRRELDALAGELEPADLAASWPVAGALIVNLRNTLEALGAVAGEQPVRVASPAAIG